jgi:2-methylfumaryl-CoA hydratase
MKEVNWDSEGPYFEDLEIGMKIKSWPRRTLSNIDNLFWLSLSGDQTAIYTDENFAMSLRYKERPINNNYLINLVLGMSIKDTSKNSLALVNIDYAKVLKPVYSGETIEVESEVIEKRESKTRKEVGIVTWIHRGLNERGEIVVEIRRTNLVYKKMYSPFKNE